MEEMVVVEEEEEMEKEMGKGRMCRVQWCVGR